MSEIILYHCPIACSQVCVSALEEVGLDYELRLIDVAAGQQSGDSYRRITGMERVPVLLADGQVVVENAAVLAYIDARAGGDRLFPAACTPLALAERQSGLSFCGATLHPIVRGIFNPSRLTDGDGAPVRSRAVSLADKAFAFAEDRLARSEGWWLGTWSIVDVYLHWALSTAEKGGYNFEGFPLLASLRERLSDRPSFGRMQRIEEESLRILADRRNTSSDASGR